MSYLNIMISRNGVLRSKIVREQQDKSKCRPGAAGKVKMLSWSSRAGRVDAMEQQLTFWALWID